MYTEQLSQGVVPAAAPIHPAATAVGTADTGGIDLLKFRRAYFVLQVGGVGAGATVDAKLQESADNVSFADISSTSLTQIVAANKIATLEIRAGQVSSGQRYVRCHVTVGVGTVTLGCVPYGGEAVHKPGSDAKHASVTQQLVV